MVYRYNTEQQAIEARQRIATTEGYPKFYNSKTLYYLGYLEINGSYFIDARNEMGKSWYASESLSADELVESIPSISEVYFNGYALAVTPEFKNLYPELPYELDINGVEVVKWEIVYDDTYNYALADLLKLTKIKYKPIV